MVLTHPQLVNENQLSSDWCDLPKASAPEFVPQPALPALRPALGEITNMARNSGILLQIFGILPEVAEFKSRMILKRFGISKS